MKKYQLVTVTSPSIEFECMGEVIPSTVIEDTKKTPNFAEPVLEKRILVSLMCQLQLMDLKNYDFVLLVCILLMFLFHLDLSDSVCLSVCFSVYPYTCQSVNSSLSSQWLYRPPSHKHVSMQCSTIHILPVVIFRMEDFRRKSLSCNVAVQNNTVHVPKKTTPQTFCFYRFTRSFVLDCFASAVSSHHVRTNFLK